MKPIQPILSLALLLLWGGSLFAQKPVAVYDRGTFWTPKKGPYIETYFNVAGASIEYEKRQDGLFPKVEVTIVIRKQDSVVNFDKTVLTGPAVIDSNFMDLLHQRRFAVPPGNYFLDATVTDLNGDSTATTTLTENINIQPYEDEVAFSDIQLIRSFSKTEEKNILSKAGYDLIPYISNYFPPDKKKLTFYTEIYNTDEKFGSGERYAIRSYLKNLNTRGKLKKYSKISVKNAKPVTIVFNQFNIKALPSGNYELVIEVRDQQDSLVKRNTRFVQRNNPKKDIKMDKKSLQAVAIENTFVEGFERRDSLQSCIQSLRPIAESRELSIVNRGMDKMLLDDLKRFFYSFWYKRNDLDPEEEWLAYYKRVQEVDKKYGTSIREGYNTDRGRVYLEYGEPDDVARRANEPSSYPYEIWHYYKAKQFSNRRFVFYDPSLLGDDYELLHSDVPGERQNRRWRLDLKNRNNTNDDVDRNRGDDHYGSEVDELYDNPK